MDTNFFKLYLDINKKLIKTMCIKSETAADLIQTNLLITKGIAAPDSKSEWKYYLNICGEYHPADTLIKVTSLDTLESIVFSKSNLNIHSATKTAYAYGTRYYYSLLKDYPDSELLINSILTPAVMSDALAAEDWTILSYDKSLVENQESTLIADLQDFIYNYQKRWHVQAFGLTDEYYNAAQFAVLCLNLIPKLLNLRASRCKSNEAHSFHIREYLSSHGRLDRYMPYMTFKQIMFLYRNITYLERNSGKVEQFKILIDKILSDRNIPLSEFSIRQLSSFDDAGYPDVRIRKKPLNMQSNVPEKDYFTLETLYKYESQTAYFNTPYLENNKYEITHTLQTSPSSVMQSKDLQSSMLDYTDSVPDTMEEVLIRTWVQLSRMGYYDVYIPFKDPKTSTIHTLKADDAFIYYIYLLYSKAKINVEYVPDFISIKELRIPRPSLTTMLKFVRKDIFSYNEKIARALLTDLPTLTPIYSTVSFFDLANRLYNNVQKQWFILGNTGDLFQRAEIAEMINTLYRDKRHSFLPAYTDYKDWLASKNLPIYDYTDEQADEYMNSLFSSATGFVIDKTKQMVNIQKAMLSIMSQLSSYTVQYLREINDNNVIPIDWAAIRIGERVCDTLTEEHADVYTDVTSVDLTTDINSYIEIQLIDRHSDITVDSMSEYSVKTHTDSLLTNDFTMDVYITFPTHVMETEYNGQIMSNYRQDNFLGYDIYQSLTAAEKAALMFTI
jgi:hypothetical protein